MGDFGVHRSLAHAALVVVSALSSRQVRPEAFSTTFSAEFEERVCCTHQKDMAVQGSEERPGSRRSIVPDGQVAWYQSLTCAQISISLLTTEPKAIRVELELQRRI